MVKCVNCRRESDGKYCPECGEKMLVVRMRVKTIFYDKLYEITHWENTVLYSLKHLLLSPGNTVKNYIHGIKKNIVKPFKYFLSVTSVNIVLFHWLNKRYFDYYISSSGNFTTEALEKEKEVQAILSANINYFETILPFFFSFFFFLLYRKKSGVNFAESIAISFYWFGTMMVLSSFTMLLSLVDIRFWYGGIILDIIYLFIAALQFTGSAKVPDIIRTVLFIVLSYGSFMLLSELGINIYFNYFHK